MQWQIAIKFFLRFSSRSDCEHFQMPPPEFPELQELEADITKHEEMWSFYVEFKDGLQTLCKEDWISFRYVSPDCVLASFMHNIQFWNQYF